MVDINVHDSSHKDLEPETPLDSAALDRQFHEEANYKLNTPGKQVVDPND